MGRITDALLRSAWDAEQHVLPDVQRYDPMVCQCCGHRRFKDTDPECVCDGLDWYMIKGGGIECQGHKMLRAFGATAKTFDFGGLK